VCIPGTLHLPDNVSQNDGREHAPIPPLPCRATDLTVDLILDVAPAVVPDLDTKAAVVPSVVIIVVLVAVAKQEPNIDTNVIVDTIVIHRQFDWR